MAKEYATKLEEILITNLQKSIDRLIYDLTFIRKDIDTTKLVSVTNQMQKEFEAHDEINFETMITFTDELYKILEEQNDYSMHEPLLSIEEFNKLRSMDNRYDILSYFLLGTKSQIDDYGMPEEYLNTLEQPMDFDKNKEHFDEFMNQWGFQTYILNKAMNIIGTPVSEFEDLGFNNAIFIEAFIVYFSARVMLLVAAEYVEFIAEFYLEHKKQVEKECPDLSETLAWCDEMLPEGISLIDDLENIIINNFDLNYLTIKN
jgi:hypothetical protein